MKNVSLVALVLLGALAGCLSDATTEPGPTTNDDHIAAPTADAAGAPTGEAAPGPITLHLLADETLSAAPPEQAGWVAYPEPVNSPFATQSPAWTGTLARGGNTTALEVPIRLFVTSSSANAAARLIPPFTLEDTPGLFVTLNVGGAEWFAAFDGPELVVAGQVAEISGTLTYQGGTAPPTVETGDPVELRVQAAYAHVQAAMELRFVMGPEHPASFTLPL